MRKAKKLALWMGVSKYEANKTEEEAAVEEEVKCLVEEAYGEGE